MDEILKELDKFNWEINFVDDCFVSLTKYYLVEDILSKSIIIDVNLIDRNYTIESIVYDWISFYEHSLLNKFFEYLNLQ